MRNNLLCLPCIAEHKAAQLAGADQELPPIREAVTLMGGTAHCLEHIQVQRQSALTLPGPAMPRLQ